MTKKEAKALTLKVWRYLAKHPEIEFKSGLPAKLYQKIMRLRNQCPLCELFFPIKHGKCPGCPLWENEDGCMKTFGASNPASSYYRWAYAKTKRTRAKYATRICDTVKGWKV